MYLPITKSLGSLCLCALVLLSAIMTLLTSHTAAAAATHIPANNTSDQLALLSFKSLLSDPQGALASWSNESLHYCQWAGITCGRRHLRVTVLELDSLNLTGTISPYLANLTFLRRLHLPNNSLHGHIPQELGLLRRLRHLNLSINSLQGEIPNTISHCSHLENLSLRNNMLQGEIPSNLSSLLELQILSLSYNKLVGELAKEFGTLPKLAILILRGNQLTGSIPPLLGSSASLTNVELWNNGFNGNIPPFLANSSSISTLVLSKNDLTGSIPPSLGNSSSLVHLDLSFNRLTGGIPPFLPAASRLRFLSLSSNNLTGGIPPELGNLTSLSSLYLAENKLGGSIPESLGNMFSMTELDLTRTLSVGEVPLSIYNLSSISYLYIGGNMLNGTLPTDLGLRFPNLQFLIMQDNQFEGPIPVTLSNASGFQVLDLARNNFSGTVPPNLGALQSLRELNIGWNLLQGHDWSFLTSLTNCSLLKKLYLQDNGLEGSLPASVGNLSTRLEWLLIGQNQIAGSIPEDIGNLVNLTVLYLDHNLFTRSIPKTMGKLWKLHILYMSGNNLSGSIPFSFGNLTQLNELDLSSNELSGNIPDSIENCSYLSLLNLSYNALGGSIPKGLVGISSLSQFLDLSHNSLVGSIPAEVSSLINLVQLNISENQLSGEIPTALGACQLLEYLNLEGNFFEGDIPETFVSLKGIKELDLSRNKLYGRIPEFLSSFESLEVLNLSFNDFEGEVPKGGVFGNASAFSILGNNKLCGGDPKLQLPPCSVHDSKRKISSHALKIVILAPGVATILLLCLFCYFYWMIKAKRRSPSSPTLEDKYKKVSYTELLKATDGFSSANLIGTGSFGSVYKGKMDHDQNVVAVKVFNLSQRGALKSFLAECDVLRNIRHRHLIKIITSCSSVDYRGNDFKALVFEFMPNGSLEEWLHPEADMHHQSRKLNLIQRLHIASDVASALDYLHHGCETPVVHCDLKPGNVLLDDDMNAHVSDFGLAKLLQSSIVKSESSSSLMGLKGSIGYVAPEYGMGGQVSTQGDVYSYGIVLLEMLTGKKPTDNAFKDNLNLHNYVEMAFPEQVMEVLDHQMLLEEEGRRADTNVGDEGLPTVRLLECIYGLFKIGLSCSKESPKERMEMGEVAKNIREIRDALNG